MTHQESPTFTREAGSRDRPSVESRRAYLEFLIRADYERCHPDETWRDLELRARFSKEDRGLLRDWMALAVDRAAAASRNEERSVVLSIAA
jgi:hypothetical protein